MKTSILFLSLVLCGCHAFGQYTVNVYGSENVVQGSAAVYSTDWNPYQPSSYDYWTWWAGGNTVISQHAFSATVNWSQVGPGYVQHELSTWEGYYTDGLSVNVTAAGPA